MVIGENIMSEFINYPLATIFFILVVFVLMLMIDEPKEKRSYGLIVASLLLFIIAVFIDPMMSYNDANKNIDLFKHQKSLECFSSTGSISNEKYLINQKDWELKDFYFIRENSGLMIRADKCEEK